MNKYSLTDVTILNKMINLKDPTIVDLDPSKTITMYMNKEDETLLFFSEKDLKRTPPEMIIKNFIRFLFHKSSDEKDSLGKFVFEESLKNVPLYLNTTMNFRIFAQWRLKIGK